MLAVRPAFAFAFSLTPAPVSERMLSLLPTLVLESALTDVSSDEILELDELRQSNGAETGAETGNKRGRERPDNNMSK